MPTKKEADLEEKRGALLTLVFCMRIQDETEDEVEIIDGKRSEEIPEYTGGR